MVQRMNQQAKDGLGQLLGKIHEDRRSKMKVETKVMEIAHDTTTKCCLAGEKKDAYLETARGNEKGFPQL
jgi:hypothetical protein